MREISGSRVIVTGGAGFIGSHLADRLATLGCEVLIIDDFSTGRRENLARHENNPLVTIVNADVRDGDAVMELTAGARFVFHLAARGVRFSLRRPSETHDVNATGTLNVLKASAAAGVERVLYCSSSEAVGNTDGVKRGNRDYKPTTIYGASKLSGEYYSRVFNNSGYVETVVARPFNNYGPRSHYRGQRGEIIPRFIVLALAGKPLPVFGGGAQTRDFTYVTETAELLVRILESGTAGEVCEICTGEEISVSEIARMVISETGSASVVENISARPGDVMRMKGDPAPLRAAVGAAPAIPFRQGLPMTVEWIRKNVPVTKETLATVSPRNWEEVEAEDFRMTGRKPSAGSRGPAIPLAKPLLGEEEAREARRAIYSGWVTQGPRVADFERAFADFTGAPYARAVSSCTAALHLALLASGAAPGDVVLTVSHSFIATANAVRHCFAEPVFIDIDPASLNVDPAALAAALDRDFERRDGGLYYKHMERLAVGESPLRFIREPAGRLAAILAVHQAGLPADMENILGAARSRGVPVVEDAACAAGSEIFTGGAWEKTGRPHGDLACFSFHPRKVITSGEGGMVTTRNPEYDEKIRLLRHQGMSVSDLERHESRGAAIESYLLTGYNYRMTDIQAAVGTEQVKRLPEIVRRRREIAGFYSQLLKDVPGVKTIDDPAWARSNRQSFIIMLEKQEHRALIMKKARGKGIAVKPGIMCAHLEKPYAAAWPPGCLPHSEAASRYSVTLPLFPAMAKREIEAVVALVAGCVVE